MRSYIFIFFIFFGVITVLYFSWIGNPRFSLSTIVPSWIANWADKHDNDNIRTAIPLFFLGIISGLYLTIKKSSRKKWFMSWVLLVILVLVAEVGQLLLPLRTSDLRDISWGALGGALGLLLMCFLKLMLNKKNKS